MLCFFIVSHLFPATLALPSDRADSGHGGQTPDVDGDEIDGYDEGQARYE